MDLLMLLNNIKNYKDEDIEMIKKAYDYANYLHDGQLRQSGEPYIVHPLTVAYILSELRADADTICAGLLHDTLEDTDTTKEEIASMFNSTVANLVDGVTKMSKMNFSSKLDQNMANTRKIITSITEDVRIVIIKLADRLHNMRTLEFKSEFKQKENSLETMEIFVPIAYYIGAYRIKEELEDISFSYLLPDEYKNVKEKRERFIERSNFSTEEMHDKLLERLTAEEIKSQIKIRSKNIYGIYKRLASGHKQTDIHDLTSLKICVDSIDNCYKTLGIVHSEYKPVNGKFKDYICSPKVNMYRSLHTTVFGPDTKLVQAQIRTFEMDKIASFGLTAYWEQSGEVARDIMQKDLKEKYQFFKSLSEINNMFDDNKEFVDLVKDELFGSKVKVLTNKGDIMLLPEGSTVVDFAYNIDSELGNKMITSKVNDEYVSDNYILKTGDRVTIVSNELSEGPKDEWLDTVKTAKAKRKIREFNNK